MKLPFGKYKNDLIHISEVQSGRTDLTCPNCGQALIAKKGKLKVHHFAHDGVSCAITFSKDLFGLYNRLPIKLPLCIYAQRKKKEIDQKLKDLEVKEANAISSATLIEELQTRLHRLHTYFLSQQQFQQAKIVNDLTEQVQQYTQKKIAPFPDFHLLRDTVFKTGYTDGKSNLAPAQLEQETHEYYYPLVFQPYVICLKNHHEQAPTSELGEQLAHYQKEVARFHQFHLYFLEVRIPTATIYKIGLTTRPISIRMKEIESDMLNYFTSVSCQVIALKKGVAFLENFFKRKYAKFQFAIGTLTEYFQFPPTQLEWIINDLECIELKEIPTRNSPLWLYWAYFQSNGKLYGGSSKYLFVNDKRYRLTSEEIRKIEAYL